MESFPAGAKVAAGGVYVIADDQADGSILAKADHTFRYLSNGDDGFKLVKGTKTVSQLLMFLEIGKVILDLVGMLLELTMLQKTTRL